MRVRVFASTERSYSIDRYTRELVAHFPKQVDAKAICFERSDNLYGRTFERYLGYASQARREQGDLNIVVSTIYSHLLLALPPAKTICVCHDPLIALRPENGNGLKVQLYRTRFRLSLRLLRRAAAVVAVSQDTRKELLEHCPFLDAAKVCVLYNGLSEEWQPVRDDSALQDFRRELGLNSQRIILTIGNDLWVKNLQGVLRAFAAIPNPDVVLVHAGTLTPATQHLVDDLGLNERFRHVQDADDRTLRLLYSAAEMLVFASFTEGFGWPPLEAMACGCPVIASARGGLPEVCGDAAVFVQPNDTNEITEKITMLLSAPDLRAELRIRGARQAARFSWDHTTAGMLRVIHSS